MSPVYEVFAASVADHAESIVQVWSRSFADLRAEVAQQKLQHSYITNPAGAGPAFMLRDKTSQTVVGVQGLVLREFYCRGAKLRAGVIADYAVDPAHRTLLPALQLLKLCIAKSAEFADFLYGFPNHKAEAVTKRAGFENVLRLQRYAVPLRIDHYLSPKTPLIVRPLLRWCGDFVLRLLCWWRMLCCARRIIWDSDERAHVDVDAIWSAPATAPLFLSRRSADVLAWRFRLAQAGGHDARPWHLAVARDAASHCPIGYVVWSLRDDVAVVGDFLCADPARHTAALMIAFQALARRAGASAISLEYCGNPAVAAALVKAGFVVRDGSPLYLFGKGQLPAVEQWYFTGFDRDTD